MASAQANPDFVATSTEHYARAGFVRRPKGARRPASWPEDQLTDGILLFQSNLPAGWRLQVLGTGSGYDQAGRVISYDHLAVYDAQGKVYAAYRRASPQNNYAICQTTQYVLPKG